MLLLYYIDCSQFSWRGVTSIKTKEYGNLELTNRFCNCSYIILARRTIHAVLFF